MSVYKDRSNITVQKTNNETSPHLKDVALHNIIVIKLRGNYDITYVLQGNNRVKISKAIIDIKVRTQPARSKDNLQT